MFRLSLCLAMLLALFAVACESGADDKYKGMRQSMVEKQLRARGIKDERVLEVMGRIPRHELVPVFYRDSAYGDFPLPIGEGQTISQPYVVALMTEALGVSPGDKVLEIGTGSGYQAAVLADMGCDVYSIEIREALAGRAEGALKDLGYGSVRVRHADGYFGWPDEAPFDAIIITASANHIPPPLIEQLKDGGRIILPLGSTVYYQVLTLGTKGEDGLRLRQMGGVAFVPMVGEMEKDKYPKSE